MTDALERSQVVVPIVSANSHKSQWFKDEITFALDKGIKIIPFCIEDIAPTGVLRMLKVRSQWINAYPKPSKVHLDKLVKAVLTHMEKSKEKEPDKREDASMTRTKETKEKKKKFPRWLLAATSLVIVIGIVFILNQILNKTDTTREKSGDPVVKSKDESLTKKEKESQKQKEQPKLEKQTGDLKKKDDRDWKTALSKNTIPAFQNYLDKHPTGKHLWKAAEKIAGLKKLAAMPDDVKKVAEKIGVGKVSKNEKDCWQANFGDGIVMVYIPAGEFKMGQTDEEKSWLIDKVGKKDYGKAFKDEAPNREVYLDGFWLGMTEVTVGQYKRFISETKHRALPYDISDYSPDDIHPVVGVSWKDSVTFCDWLSKKYDVNFKLPTEAQWEKGARGRDGRKYPWGNREPDKYLANFAGNIGKSTPVGSYPNGASPYGLLDMAGNVWEWCSDWYDANYYKNSPKQNPIGPPRGSDRVFRGGS